MTDPILTQTAEAPKPALHQSILAAISRCGMQVYFNNVKNLKVPPGIAMIVGTGSHSAADMALVAKAKGEKLEPGAVEEKARETVLATAAGEGVLLDEDEKKIGEKIVVAAAATQAANIARTYVSAILPKRTPKSPAHVERRLRANLNGFPFDLEGTIDLHEADGSLRDLKTAGRKPDEQAAVGNVQLETYALLTTLADAVLPAKLGLDVLVKRDSGAIDAFTREAMPPTNFDAVKARIEHAAKVIQTGSFYPADPHGPSGWVCTAKFCGYYNDVCPFGKRGRTSVAIGGAP